MKNKNHWYDGWFYDRFIAPNMDTLFGEIKNLIDENSSVIDAGCGTGRLVLQLADKCKSVTGVDLSGRNIYKAKRNLEKFNSGNIKIIHGDVAEIKESRFDFSTMTFVIHEMAPSERIKVLRKLGEISDKIIIGDYITPQPVNLIGKMNVVIEFLAGRDHYNNYRHFISDGGIKSLAEQAGLKILDTINDKPVSAQIMVLEK